MSFSYEEYRASSPVNVTFTGNLPVASASFSTGLPVASASISSGGAAFFSSSSSSSGAAGLSAGLGGGVVGGASAQSKANQIAQDLLLAAGASGSASGSGSGASFGGSSSGSGSGAGVGGGLQSTTTYVSYSAGGSSGASGALAGGAVAGGNYNGVFLSEIEQSILRSTAPIVVNESEEITVNGQRGIWANRQEVVNWRGPVAITEYQINEDSNPEIITKRSSQSLEYIQELAIRYLRPPTPPAPGEIIITQEANTLTPPAPPLIIRQQPARPSTPEPLVVREAPPQAPAQVGRKVITISGKRIPPQPRKVIIERLASLPSKPQSVLIERWLPYAQVKRRVIFNRPQQQDPVIVKPRNVIVQWEAPRVQIKKEIKYLGVIRANPAEYVSRYGASLKQSADLPSFVQDIKTPDGLVLAANYRYNNLYELEGDLQALRLVDLDREGLAEYRAYLQRVGINYTGAASYSAVFGSSSASGAASASFGGQAASFGGASAGSSFGAASGSSFVGLSGGLSAGASAGASFAEEIFASINKNSDNRISRSEAESALLKLNSRLGRSYGEDDVTAFFAALDTNGDGYLDFEEFRRAFLTLFA